MEKGNLYWASFRAALYAAAVVVATSRVVGCIDEEIVLKHNCALEQAAIDEALAAKYESFVVVRKVKTDDSRGHYDWDAAKLLLYKAAEGKYGAGSYEIDMEESAPCDAHGDDRPARIWYTVRRREGGAS